MSYLMCGALPPCLLYAFMVRNLGTRPNDPLHCFPCNVELTLSGFRFKKPVAVDVNLDVRVQEGWEVTLL